MADTMQCVRITEPGGVDLDELPVSETGPEEVLVENEAMSVGQAIVNSVDTTVGVPNFVLTCDNCEESLSGHSLGCPISGGRVAVEFDGGSR